MATTPEKATLTPAYGSFKTFNAFLDLRREDGHVVDAVDRSLMTKFAGSTAGELLSGLKYLGFITEKGTPTALFADYVPADDEARMPILERAMRDAYKYLFQTEGFNIERATSQQMADQFRAQGISGSTLARAIMFFLAAAKQAGIKVSPNVKAPPMSGGPAKRPRPAAAPAVSAPATASAHTPAGPPQGVQVFEIPIPIGRKVSITIPSEFSAADWELFQTMLTAYVQHWKTQTAALKPATAEKEDSAPQ